MLLTIYYRDEPGGCGFRAVCARLPAAAKDYVERIEELAGVPVGVISTSPDRNGNVFRSDAFDNLLSR